MLLSSCFNKTCFTKLYPSEINNGIWQTAIFVCCRWLSNFDASPGLTEQSFTTIRDNINSAKSSQYRLCALTLDEMEIKKHLEIDRRSGNIVGFVDIGCGELNDDSQPQATKVLMLVAVGINAHWKIPLGYWLTDGSTSELQASIILTALHRLYEVGNVAVSVTADGAPCNIKCFEKLGARLKGDDICSYFYHPCDANVKVAIFLDACHMLKLVRNMLSEYKILKIPSHGKVMLKHIEDLQSLQDNEGLSLANKLTRSHIEYHTQNMKVKLAAQLLSSSVAKALQFLRAQKYAQFIDSEATQYFISVVDRLFDILNSRSIMARGFKKPMNRSNIGNVTTFLIETKEMLLSIENSNGVKLVSTKRRTCIIGLIANIDSVLLMYDQLIMRECNSIKLSYLLTYKFSQDHVELIFGLIRRRGGNNNNPTALQFRRTYRAILSHIGVVPSQNSNVTVLDSTELLGIGLDKLQQVHQPSCNLTSVSSPSGGINDTPSLTRSTIHAPVQQKEDRSNTVVALDTCDLLLDVEEIDDLFEESDDSNVGELPVLSEYSENISCYIAGYIVRKLLGKLKCDDCCNQLFVTSLKDAFSTALTFLCLKNNGGLIIPSPAVVSVVLYAERCLREICESGKNNLSFVSQTVYLEQRVLSGLNLKHFDEKHMQDTLDGIDNHVYSLIRHIVRYYVNVRKFHAVKCWNIKTKGKNVRQRLTKTVLFKNQ